MDASIWHGRVTNEGGVLTIRPGLRDASAPLTYLAATIVFATADAGDPWMSAQVRVVAVMATLFLVGFVRARVVVDASGIVSRRWRTRSWAWSEIARLHRDVADLAFVDPEPEERRPVLLVPVRGRRRKLPDWAPSRRSRAVQRFDALVLERAAAAGVDTSLAPASPVPWWRRELPAPKDRATT